MLCFIDLTLFYIRIFIKKEIKNNRHSICHDAVLILLLIILINVNYNQSDAFYLLKERHSKMNNVIQRFHQMNLG